MKTHGQKPILPMTDVDSTQNSEQEESKKESWKEDYLRVLADYRNLVKRTEEEKKETRGYAIESVVGKLLPVFDNLERADEHINDQGLSLALQEARLVLRSLGVEKIESSGKPFDPYMMDCVDLVEGTPGTVVSTIESGYRLYDRILRPAKVTVGKNTDTEPIQVQSN